MISHKYKLIFIHIPKCAGRSICSALDEEFDHFTASYYKTYYSACWHQYTVFSVIRNPYDRLVSMYNYIKSNEKHATEAITNYNQMLPFKSWVTTNIAAFKGEFNRESIDGEREGDGEVGSTFWFSSQVSRLSLPLETTGANIHILRYEDGMQAVGNFLQEKIGITFDIPHLNSSGGPGKNKHMKYYDQELLNAVNNFQPFKKDCNSLNYKIITNISAEMHEDELITVVS